MLTLIKKSRGILGMNARNLSYVGPNNSKRAIDLANNKLRSKEVLFAAGIPVPKVYGIIKNRKELENFRWESLPQSFVLKPNRGMGGEGIKVVYGQKKDGKWILGENRTAEVQDFKSHILNIFDGFYSLFGGEDIAFLEERIKISTSLKPYSYRGIPDVRVIVYNNVPVMAMLRLSTKESGGKANLHLGGIGVGIDIATGITTHAIHRDKAIEKTPETKLKLSGIRIPYWKSILEIAIRCQKASGLGYIGVDIAIDKEKGPVVLEINAHAGLSIQIANLAPLKYRLGKVRGIKIKSESHAIRVAQDLFGGEVEQEIEEISGKQILGIIENVKIRRRDIAETVPIEEVNLSKKEKALLQKAKEKEFIEIKAKIDTGANSSSFDKTLAKELGYGEVINEFDGIMEKIERNDLSEKDLNDSFKKNFEKWGEAFSGILVKSSHGSSYRLIIKMDIVLSGIKIHTPVTIIDRSDLQFPAIIGRKSLKNFLVDPSKTSKDIL
ncbi:MAG: sugar-transfer associated ATP-grasp domain-containing protein [Candidatus Paceibacterota bacterium]